MNMGLRRHRIFGAGDAFRAADGAVYRITRAVTVNGVDLIVYDTVRGGAPAEPAAIPVEEFANLLSAQGAVLIPETGG